MRNVTLLAAVGLFTALISGCAVDGTIEDQDLARSEQDLHSEQLPVGVYVRTPRGMVLKSYIRNSDVFLAGTGPATQVGTLPIRKGMEMEFVKQYLYIYEGATLLRDHHVIDWEHQSNNFRFLQLELDGELITLTSPVSAGGLVDAISVTPAP